MKYSEKALEDFSRLCDLAE